MRVKFTSKSLCKYHKSARILVTLPENLKVRIKFLVLLP